ncbi:serine/threonine-protein kinase [Vineibacter terrae]|uniref:serine/threonine-protein kinase n=1 Tax=Vineibacter terrae TaxID=2586908 RepID=UPI002E33CC9B|nr:serine/threonine-protein kinase [Vineibacter terrae]HEX2890143.1 serine/threonine-protein kinase [Vineibacter terrae]
MSAGHSDSAGAPPRWHASAAPAGPPPFAQTAGVFPAMTPLQPGVVLNNTHRIDQMLGRGGMGEVYRGTNVHTGDQVAIKVIRPELVDDANMRDLFLREAMALRKIRHPAVVSYEGASADSAGRLYLVMDFVAGPSLAQLVARQPLSPAQVRALRRRVAEGLQAAHEQNVVHRDLSPDNVILRDGDLSQATIIDFGIARRTDIGKTSVIGQSFAGKIEYAAPEQFGMFTGKADARSDVYTLGLVLVACSLGGPLDMGASAMAAIEARMKVPDLSQVSPELRPGLAGMLEPDPARRPQSMRDVLALDALDAAAVGRHRRRGPSLAVLVGGLALAAMVGTAFVFADPVAMVRSLFASDTRAGEGQAWQAAMQADTAAAYRAFLERYPDGRHAAEARQRLAAAERVAAGRQEEDELWRRAQAATTAEPVRDYLQRYPSGRYAEAARRKLADLQKPDAGPPAAMTWSPVPCASIPLWVPAGFTCQVSSDHTLPGSAGRYRSYMADTAAGGWQTQIWMSQALGEQGVVVAAPADRALPQLNATTRAGTDWSTVLTYGGAEFMTFRNDAANCVALRKPGTRRGQDYVEMFAAMQCAPPGQPLYPNDIRTTIDGVRVK